MLVCLPWHRLLVGCWRYWPRVDAIGCPIFPITPSWVLVVGVVGVIPRSVVSVPCPVSSIAVGVIRARVASRPEVCAASVPVERVYVTISDYTSLELFNP